MNRFAYLDPGVLREQRSDRDLIAVAQLPRLRRRIVKHPDFIAGRDDGDADTGENVGRVRTEIAHRRTDCGSQ